VLKLQHCTFLLTRWRIAASPIRPPLLAESQSPLSRDNAIGSQGASAVLEVAGGLTSACLGVPLDVARAALLARGPALAALNCPKSPAPPVAAEGGAAAAAPPGGTDGAGRRHDWLELRVVLLAGGVVAGLARDALIGLPTLYDMPYSHATKADGLRAAAVAAGCTHVVVAATRVGEGAGGGLKVAAAGEASVVLARTVENETRVSHGVHWYCRTGRGFGFAPNDDIETSRNPLADTGHRDDPLRLSWQLNGEGGYRAGDACDLCGSDGWRKVVWGFSL
jgi:hypothetical protein